MSVEKAYLAVDWKHLKDVPADVDLAAYLFNAVDEEEPWLRQMFFDNEFQCYFESYTFLSEFTEWFESQRKGWAGQIAQPFADLFLDLGLLQVEPYGELRVVKKESPTNDEWLVASVPPAEVQALCAKASGLDVPALQSEVNRSLSVHPFEPFEDSDAFAGWIMELRNELSSIATAGQGILMGIA